MNYIIVPPAVTVFWHLDPDGVWWVRDVSPTTWLYHQWLCAGLKTCVNTRTKLKPPHRLTMQKTSENPPEGSLQGSCDGPDSVWANAYAPFTLWMAGYKADCRILYRGPRVLLSAGATGPGRPGLIPLLKATPGDEPGVGAIRLA